MTRRMLALLPAVLVGCVANIGQAYVNLQAGDMLLVKREYKDAIKLYDMAIQADPTLADPYLHRGMARRGDGDFDGAIADFSKAAELNPMLGKALVERARTRIAKLGTDRLKLEEAWSQADPLGIGPDIDRAVALTNAGGDDTAIVMRGAIRLMQKRDADAKLDFERYLRRRPKYKADVGNAVEAWTRDRPVLDFELIDALAKFRPKPN